MATHSRILARKAGSKAAKCGLKTLFLILERRKEEKKMQGRGERRRQNRILSMKETSKNLNREQIRVRLAAWGWPGSETILLRSRKELALAMEQDGWQNLVNRQDLLPQS